MVVWKQRRGTAAALASANEIPADGQIVFETDTNRLKIGTGVTTYTLLPYLDNEIYIADVIGLQTSLNDKQAAGSYSATVHTHVLADVTGLGTAAAKNFPASGNASGVDVVIATDTRLSDQRTPLDSSVVAAKLAPALKIDGGIVT